MRDVVVIGGGAAGLSGAVTLARARRSVLVVDDGDPAERARRTGCTGSSGRRACPRWSCWSAVGRSWRATAGSLRTGRVVAAPREDDGFVVTLDDGTTERARRLLVATGLVDDLPAIPGLRERWGHDVLHCPYCHGWEVRDQPIGVLATSERAVHQALLFRQWSDDVVLLQHTARSRRTSRPSSSPRAGIRVVRGVVVEVLVDGRSAQRRAAGVRRRGRAVRPHGHAAVRRASRRARRLGLTAVPHEMGVGEHAATDLMGASSVPGVWVAGNATDLMAQVRAAMAAGTRAAAALNMDLIAEDTGACRRRSSTGKETVTSRRSTGAGG